MDKQAFVKDTTLDEYVTERTDVIVNKLLGDYNKSGHYVINKKIMSELIEMPKSKRSSFNNAIFCISKNASGDELIFEIVFKKNTKNQVASAQINVLENIEKVNGYIINTLKTPVGKFTDSLSADFVTKACKTFNIDQIVGDAKEKKEDNEYEKVNYIETRMKLISALDNITQEDYNKIYEEYFNKRLALLKTLDSGFANEIIEIFNNEYSKVQKYFLLDNSGKKLTDYKSLNELLDKAFEDVSGIKPEYSEQEKLYRERILPVIGMFAYSAAEIEKLAEEQVEKVVPRKERDMVKEALTDRQEIKQSTITPEIKETSQIKQDVKQTEQAKEQTKETGLTKPGDRLKNIGDWLSKSKNNNQDQTTTATPTATPTRSIVNNFNVGTERKTPNNNSSTEEIVKENAVRTLATQSGDNELNDMIVKEITEGLDSSLNNVYKK